MWASGNFSCFVIVARHDTYASDVLLFIAYVDVVVSRSLFFMNLTSLGFISVVHLHQGASNMPWQT